jgi:hypothetical protein
MPSAVRLVSIHALGVARQRDSRTDLYLQWQRRVASYVGLVESDCTSEKVSRQGGDCEPGRLDAQLFLGSGLGREYFCPNLAWKPVQTVGRSGLAEGSSHVLVVSDVH